MADYTFFTNPMSRGQIARWALHEVAADYEQVIVQYGTPPPELLDANAMAKLPTIVHHARGGDRAVAETAAICLYLAQMHPDAGLLPTIAETADYLRWTFFAAGPVEAAITVRALDIDVPPEKQAMAGFGSYERTMRTLEQHLTGREWVCGDRFTMADVYVGSQVDWGLTFGTMPPEPAFVAYAERLQARPAYQAAKAVDNALIAQMKR